MDNTQSRVPPGFRFHPTDEELVDYYLKKKVSSKRIDLDVIRDIDLYRLEPWDLQERCKIGYQEQTEWYFFSHKDKKYPTGTRTNRATVAGFWKATGRDKAIYAKLKLIGMRKTLVFYKGRAPNGQKTDWIMHEYRLETNENAAPQAKGWVVCRAFKKRTTAQKIKGNEMDSASCYEERTGLLPELDSSNISLLQADQHMGYNQHPFTCKQELEQLDYQFSYDPFLQLPQLESPKLPCNANSSSSTSGNRPEYSMTSLLEAANIDGFVTQSGTLGREHQVTTYNEEHVTDWRLLDKFVASQLSQDDLSEDARFSDAAMYSMHSDMGLLLRQNSKLEVDYAASSSNCDDDIWAFGK
eukprot:Gb_40805 [translate_table: standard]